MRLMTGGDLRRWAFRGLLVLSLVGALLAYAGPLLYELRGQQLMVLTSGSMAPLYPAGSAVVAEPITPDQLRVGQVITFRPDGGEKFVTHRIVALRQLPKTDEAGNELRDSNGRLLTAGFAQTMGDGNEDPDPNLINVSQVRFLIVDGYPELGSWLLWSRTPMGKLILFAPPFLLLLAAEMWSWRRPLSDAPRPAHPRRPSSSPTRSDDVVPARV
jgi:signal peptidase I